MARPTTASPTQWLIPILAISCVLTSGGARAQDEARLAEPIDSFAAAIEVELLDLQVVVTDEEGRRVSGLPRTAFRILVDGEDAPIDLFAEIRDPLEDESIGRSPPTAPDEVAATEAPPVNYLVFIDDLMTQESRRNVVLRRLRADLDLLRPGDRMAVVRLARERRLQVLTDWSSDRAQIEAAIDRALDLPAWGIKYIALRRMEAYVANWEGNDTRRSVLAAAGSMRLLERPAGRRALLLVAGSWDPAEVNRADYFSPWCVTGWCQGAAVYNVLTDTANLFGYAIYAIDVEGRDPDVNWGREKRLHAVLGELARVTGGRRMLNGDRLQVLAGAIEDTRSYYAIGVTPPSEMKQRRTRVEIEVLRDGLTARSQTAFVPITAEIDRQLDVLNALWLGEDELEEEGLAAETPGRPLRLTLNHAERLHGGLVGVLGHVVLRAASLEWRSEGDREYADVAVEAAYVDWRGDSSPVVERRIRLWRERGNSRGELVLPWPFELRRRRHTLVVGVRDLLARTSYTAVAEIAPRERPRRKPVTREAIARAVPE